MSEAFPVEQFRDVFQVTPKIKNKLQPFMAQYKALNMDWIINSFEELHRYFFEDRNDITLKFNSIFGIKFLFDTAEVVLVNLIEIYFLPKLLEIASFDAKGGEDKRGTGYFASVGYPKQTPDIEKLSYNFVRLASEFVQVAATVKTKRLYLNEEIDDPSDYAEACQRLQQLGWKPYAKPAYYKDTAPAIAAQYKKSLQAFDQIADPYIDFYSDFFRIYLQKGKGYQGRLNPKKVLQSGDVYITGPVIDLCVEYFHSKSVRQRMQSLGLLNEFIRWGDVEAAYNINCTELIDDTLRELANIDSGIVNLSRGKSMFTKLESSEQLKQQFYIETLKAIQFWSLCFPRALKVKNRDSKIKSAHDELRMKLKIQFPEDKNLKENKMEFDRNIAKKRRRNNLLLADLENEDPDYVSIVPIKTNNQVAQVKQTPQPPPAGSDFARIKALINETSLCLNTILESEAAIPQKIQKLNKFRNQFENNVENADVDDEEFNELLETGSPLVDRIEKVLPHLNNYSSKRISFKQLSAALTQKPKQSRLKEAENESPKKVAQPAPAPVTESKVKVQEPPKSEKQIKVEEKPKSENKIKVEEAPKREQPKLEEAPKREQPKLEEASLKLNENSIKSAEKQFKSGPIKQELKSIKQAVTVPKVTKTMQQVEQKVSKESIKAIPEIKPMKTEEIKHKIEESKPKIQQIKPVLIESRKTQNAQVTPIKKMQDESFRQKFSEERSMSSLPQVSKQSLSKSLNDEASNHEELNIEPASHQILDEKEVINLNLFKEKNEFSTSLNQKKQQEHPNFIKKQLNEELEEQIEQDVEINPPKIIDNVKGSYKIKPEGSQPVIRAPEILKDSRASSKRGSRIDFQESKMSKVEPPIEDDDDIIMMPDINPLDVSYHDIGGFEDQLKENKELSFKKCFEAEKYLLGPNKNTKMFWLEKDTASLIKPGNIRRSSRNKDSSISIPEILSEKDKKYQEQLRYVEEQKNRKIRELELKITNLQTEGKQLQQKIVEQDKQIKSFKADSSVSNSRAKKNFYLEDQDQLFRTKHAQKYGKEKERSFYDEPRVKESKILEPQGKLISSRKYAEYFASFGEEKRKKTLLKNKELLFKNEEIEFGCMSRREGDTLIVTFYITPQSGLEGLTYTLNPVANSSLAITVEPRHIAVIRKKKQEKVIVSVKVSDIPYHLPEIEFNYNLDGKMDSKKFIIPCAFHKFLRIDPALERELSSAFQLSKSIIRGEEVPYSRKLLKNMEVLAEYFPNGTLIRDGGPNENGEIEFAGKAQWGRERFWLKILIKPSQFLCVQAAGENLSNAVEFYISLVTSLLMKNMELSQTK